MDILFSMNPTRFIIVIVFGLSVALSSASVSAAPKTVKLSLRISDSASGLDVRIEKNVTEGTKAWEALRQMVEVEHRESGLGVFVKSLCGVKPPRGMYWALYLDGKLSDKGISRIVLRKDSKIEWKTQKP